MEPTPSRPYLPRGYGMEKDSGAPGWGTATEIGETITRWKFDRSD